MSLEYWVWLSEVLATSTAPLKAIVEKYGDAKAFYDADDDEKMRVCGLSIQQAKRLHDIPRKRIFGIIRDCERLSIRIAVPGSSEYPEKLFGIVDPPVVLYIKGKPLMLNGEPSIAIVGPRKISDYGAKCGYVIAGTLASCGMTVVSGGAKGGDSCAHKGAIDSGGFTVGVLGGGIESGYLKTNAELRSRIAENGALISEFSPFTSITRGTFQRRNRIISALSDGVVVLEAGVGSGTLITARHASEQGKDVFVIPGSPSEPQYYESNRLIADGARPLLNINDIINEYLYIYPNKLHKPDKNVTMPSFRKINENSVKKAVSKPKEESAVKVNKEPQKQVVEVPNLATLTDTAQKVYNAVTSDFQNREFSVDSLIDMEVCSVSEAFAAVTELEIFGFIKAIPGGRYHILN